MGNPEIKRAPLRLHSAIVIPFLVFFIALFVYTVSFSSHAVIPFQLAGQVYAIIALLLSFRYWPPMTKLVIRMPMAHRIIFGLIITCMILGHLTIRPRSYFPFITWEIFPFVREDDPVTCREFIATTASGKKVRLLVEQLFPSIVQIDSLDDTKRYSPKTLQRLVYAMVKVYNEHHADDPVGHVDLMVMAIKLHPPANELRTQPSCELLRHYKISSGL